MSGQPPPYPGSEKGAPPGQPGYPQGYGPPPQPYQPQPGYPQQYGQPGFGPVYGDLNQIHLVEGQQQGYAPPPQQYPPGQYPPGPQHTQTTVVMAQPTVAVMQQFRESPVHTRCPHCQAEVVTGTTYESGTFAWIICVILCVIGCDLGCCFIPFCVDGCKDVVHQCPNCHQQVARWNRM